MMKSAMMKKEIQEVPPSLRTWFLVHFFADLIFAIPLLLAPKWFLGMFGWSVVDPVASRLVAAALFGIGGTSLVMHKAGLESFQTMLTLKIIWSTVAIIGMLFSIRQGAPASTWLFVAIFAGFSALWIRYKRALREQR